MHALPSPLFMVLSLSRDLHDRVVQWHIQNNWYQSWLTWLAAQLVQLLRFSCTTMYMEPQQTHTESIQDSHDCWIKMTVHILIHYWSER